MIRTVENYTQTIPCKDLEHFGLNSIIVGLVKCRKNEEFEHTEKSKA